MEQIVSSTERKFAINLTLAEEQKLKYGIYLNESGEITDKVLLFVH